MLSPELLQRLKSIFSHLALAGVLADLITSGQLKHRSECIQDTVMSDCLNCRRSGCVRATCFYQRVL